MNREGAKSAKESRSKIRRNRTDKAYPSRFASRSSRLRGFFGYICTATSLLVAGCTVGPNFKKPESTVPAAWVGPTTAPTTRQSVAVIQPTDVSQWWTVFKDPVLDSLIQRAVESNLDLRQAESRIRSARASRGVAGSSLWPGADVSGGYRRSGNNAGERDLFNAGLDASWELDIFGGTRRSIESADADIRSSIEDRRDVLITLVSEVAFNYIDLRGFQRQIEIAYSNLDAQRRTTRLTQERFDGGFVSGLDVANANATVATTESQIPTVEASVRQTIYNLSILLGREPGALLAELQPSAAIPSVPRQIPVGLPSDLLRRRPDIRRAEADLHSATAQVGVATSDLFPRFTLTGDFGFSSRSAGNLLSWSNRTWSIGPGISWPIFDAGRIRSNITLQNAFAEQAMTNYERIVLIALQDVENALIAYQKEQQRRESLVVAVDANRRAVQLATDLYAGGLTGFLDLLNAQRSLLATEDALVRSDRTIAANLVSLYKALGGGWDDAKQ